jgi:hypothetical protein
MPVLCGHVVEYMHMGVSVSSSEKSYSALAKVMCLRLVLRLVHDGFMQSPCIHVCNIRINIYIICRCKSAWTETLQMALA